MSRSTKKGPYVLPSLYKKVEALNEAGKKSVVKTWSRSSTIFPEFVGHTFAVHDGASMCPCTLPRTWLATSWASLHLPASSPATSALRPPANKRGGTSNGSTGYSPLRPH